MQINLCETKIDYIIIRMSLKNTNNECLFSIAQRINYNDDCNCAKSKFKILMWTGQSSNLILVNNSGEHSQT